MIGNKNKAKIGKLYKKALRYMKEEQLHVNYMKEIHLHVNNMQEEQNFFIRK